ncbi:MAG: ABC transporter ATP-binding protein [Oliverpabstia sp.]|nr:ABC transporter ATP-binding protein/permease [Eubacterium sp.]MDY2595358.1 ABC transporter ATP-binding protein [Oliverpabstia sp.]
MRKLMKYLKRSAGFIVMIVLLLFLQAYCELSLPSYTSNIVNVGIQQKGIEDGVPKQMRKETMEHLKLFMNEEEQEKVSLCYQEKGDSYQLEKIDDETRAELNDILGKAELMMSSLTEQEEMAEKIDGMPDTMLNQIAVLFVQKEYEAMGENLDSIQMKYLLRTGLLMLGLALIGMIAAVCVTFLAARVAAALGHDLRDAVYRKVIGFSSGEYSRFSTASLITRSTNDIQQVQTMMTMLFRIACFAPIMGIGGILKALQTNVSMSWIIALAVGVILLVIMLLFVIAMPRFKKLQVLIDRMNLVTRELLTGIMVTRAFSREKHEEERFEKANHDLMKTNLFVNRCMTFMMPIIMLIMNCVSLLIVYFGSHAIDAGNMQVGDMMAFIQYAMQIIMSFLMLTMLSIMLPRASVSAGRISEVLETETLIHDPEKPSVPAETEKGTVSFEHVSFAYPDAEENVLTDIHFTAKKGETVAIIGSTGSGKSTLVNLIPRFYDVTEGTVRIDGVDVRQMTQKDVRDRLGYVPQKGVLFSGTIDSNIRFGRPEAPTEEVERAARIAQAEEFILAKPEGYQSPIAQGGTNVSGGQKQRLSIARAIEKNPEILIFDDSFSALDYKTDVAVRKALKEATADTTTIIVAQRISTILHADKIIVLDEGRMAGIGTHKELMKNCEVYQQIAKSQLSEEELAE